MPENLDPRRRSVVTGGRRAPAGRAGTAAGRRNTVAGPAGTVGGRGRGGPWVAVAALAILLLAGCGRSSVEPIPTDDSAARSVVQHDAAGADDAVYTQRVLVRHPDKTFVWIQLYIVRKPDGSREVVDPTGRRYRPSLADFRAHNRILTSRDTIVLPDDFPATTRTGQVHLISVSGHTGTPWLRWLLGAAAVLALLAAAAAVLLLVRARRRAAADTSRLLDGLPADDPY